MAAIHQGSVRPLLISFSGLDGAGKSTQIENLRSFIEARGLRTRVLAFWDDVVVFRAHREDFVHQVLGSERGVGAPERPVNRRDKNVSRWYLTVARHALYLMDAINARRVLRRARGRAHVVILDRYIYDELANLPLQYAATRAFARLVARIVPTPDVAYLLDADPMAARARKPEYPVDFLHRSRMSYYRLAAMLKTLTLIPTVPLADACRIVESAFDKLASRETAVVPAPQLPDHPGLSA